MIDLPADVPLVQGEVVLDARRFELTVVWAEDALVEEGWNVKDLAECLQFGTVRLQHLLNTKVRYIGPVRRRARPGLAKS